MDLVYTYRSGSVHGDLELRYSLRSMIKHLLGIRRVIIVGDMPAGLRNIIHIPRNDPHDANPARNIYEKIRAACLYYDLSDRFIYCADDHYLLSDYYADNFPYYYKGDISDVTSRLPETHAYRAHLVNTFAALNKRDLPTKFFNLHCPVLYDKHMFLQVTNRYDWDLKKSYVSKSLYANSLKIEGVSIADEKKFHWPMTRTAIERQLAGRTFFSTDHNSLNDNMKCFLQKTFPDQSIYEI